MKTTAAFLLLASSASAFVAKPAPFRQARHVVHLEDHIADLIDQELWRQGHKSEWQEQRNQRTAMVLEKDLPAGFEADFNNYMPEGLSPRQLKKDKMMARNDPATYCADRCVSTGNCEVFEDVFSLSPSDVMKFCTDCVLSEEEEPCDVPEAYLEDDQSYYKMMP